MQISREYLVAELKLVKKTLDGWIKDLENPMVAKPNSADYPAYPQGVPQSISIADMEGIPENQLRAELLAIAGKLEALAAT